MIVFENRHVRRFVGRLEQSDDPIATFKRFAESERLRAAWIRASGFLEWADITFWDSEREAFRTSRRIDGPLVVTEATGSISMRLGEPYVELRASFARETDRGVEVLGGQISMASALSLEFVIEGLEDVRLERDEEPSTGMSVWKGERTGGVMARGARSAPGRETMRPAPARDDEEPARPAPPPRVEARGVEPRGDAPRAMPEPSVVTKPRIDGSPSWADVARASSNQEDSADDLHPKKGDWIEHRQFGICRIDGEDVDGGALIRLPNAVRKVIKLDFFEILPPRFEGDRKIFPLRPRKR